VLGAAAWGGSQDVVQLLLDHAVDLERFGQSAQRWAIRSGHGYVIELLRGRLKFDEGGDLVVVDEEGEGSLS
jgi:hypothetical protein